VVSQANRSQLRNKTEAITRLTTLLLNALIKPKKRKPTKPSRGMIERRLKQKKMRSETKKSRGNWDKN
jgi:ribosome-associated protein